jgi:hypothetical protein
MTKYTYTVTEFTFATIGMKGASVVNGKVVANGLTRSQVIDRFGAGVEFNMRNRPQDPEFSPEFLADPEWR